MRWNVVGDYLFDTRIIQGAWTTVYLSILTMAIACVLGIALAVARMSESPLLRYPSQAYIWFFRGTPVLVQLIFWFNLASLTPVISIELPFLPSLYEGSTNELITPLVAALLGLGLNEGAYMAEIVRAGLLSVDNGQTEAASSLGMRRGHILRRIVLPQAMRVIIPPSGNEFINLVKTTSLVSVITLSELVYSAQSIYTQNFQVIPLLIVASLWYLAMVTVMSFLQRLLENRYSRGAGRSATKRRRTFTRLNARQGGSTHA
ncbi:ABC transporter permease [Pimelobacter sp. 30-1]|nr:ABC transporter permease [Pimelobacter sp. 30-1]